MSLFRRLTVCLLPSFSLLLLTLAGTPVRASGYPLRAVGLRTAKAAATSSSATTVLRGRASWYGSYFQGRRTSSGERYNRFKYTCAHKTLPFGTFLRVTNVKNGKSVVVRVSDRGPFRHARILDLSEIAARPLGIVDCGAATVVAEVVAADTPLGPATSPDNLSALYAADPCPEAAFTTYLVPAPANSPIPANSLAPADSTATPALLEAATVATAQVAPASESVDCPTNFLIQAGSFLDPANAHAVQTRIQSLLPTLPVAISQDLIDGRQRNRVFVGNFGDRPEAEAVRQQLLDLGISGLIRTVTLR